MIETAAILLLVATASAWLAVAAPEIMRAWAALARDLDPPRAAQHAVLFAPRRTTADPRQVPAHP